MSLKHQTIYHAIDNYNDIELRPILNAKFCQRSGASITIESAPP